MSERYVVKLGSGIEIPYIFFNGHPVWTKRPDGVSDRELEQADQEADMHFKASIRESGPSRHSDSETPSRIQIGPEAYAIDAACPKDREERNPQ